MNSGPDQIARRLGTSRRRVVSAAHRLGLGRLRLGQWIFTADEERALREELGVDPRGPLPRSQMRVLAELALRPCGLASARAVAQACVLAPATASGAVKGLMAANLVLIGADGVLHANVLHPRWVQLRPSLRRVYAPSPAGRSQPAVSRGTAQLPAPQLPDPLGQDRPGARLPRQRRPVD